MAMRSTISLSNSSYHLGLCLILSSFCFAFALFQFVKIFYPISHDLLSVSMTPSPFPFTIRVLFPSFRTVAPCQSLTAQCLFLNTSANQWTSAGCNASIATMSGTSEPAIRCVCTHASGLADLHSVCLSVLPFCLVLRYSP